ncbi:DUF1385 domain-containing protein [Orenia marismortui]|uniref:Uncharacterized protein YqhQ n=1 Tax=Orenia marismortui TaxID=46469 RepID=A0A4R8H570_9FIRM|nr:DUF1385 domain-containing protein [Orenia marismortui]TDX52299.1 uncharacterized protein YqhQ [Orenia marismortui]
MKIGGRAYKNGVRLVGENYSVKAYYDNDQLKYIINRKVANKNKFLVASKKIPIIRGMISFIFALLSFFKEASGNPRRYWPILLIFSLDILLESYFILMPESSNDLLTTLSQINSQFYIIMGIIVAFLLRQTLLKDTFKFHGAEHKAVNYFEADYQTPLIEQSRLANRCGTNLIVFYFIIINLFVFFGIYINVYLESLLAIGIAYEIISLAPDSILSIAYLFQKFTTIEPDKRHLKAAETALNILMSQEDEGSPPLII